MIDKNGIERCDIAHDHKNIIKEVRGKMPDEEMLYDLAELFKVFGDSTRVRILCVLFESEMCVCDIAELLNMSQSAISHQLRVLKQAKLLKNRRDGKTIYYSLADDHVRTIFNQGLEHINE
ncbi:MAG: metalloregulator ArsR/SmtB family transcription factor [Eubacterium sp.]